MNGFVFFKEYHKNPNIVVGDYYVLRFWRYCKFEKNVEPIWL
jgi:hypothetical protein